MNFEEVYEEFKEYVEKRHKKQGFYTITHDFNNHVLPYFRNTDIKNLTKNNVLIWQNAILDKKFSNQYNAKLYYVFNVFAKYCVLRSYLDNNVVSEVGPFKKKIEIKKQHVVYTLSQFLRFSYHLNDYVIRQFFTMIYFYGLRPGEATALRFCDYNKKYIYVRHNIHQKVDRELDTPKNQSSIRVLKINLLMRLTIKKLKRYYFKKYGNFKNDYFIFGGPSPLSHTTIDRYKKEAYTKAKLPSITQHEFRHSYATRNIHKKVPIDIVSRSMGHSKVSTTLDIYLHQEKNTLNVFSSMH